jgi:hypothetical protein
VPKIGAKLSQQNQHLKVKTPRQIHISKNILIISVPCDFDKRNCLSFELWGVAFAWLGIHLG